MKKLFCAILMLLLCVSCFAGTLYIKVGEKFYTYENVEMDITRSGSIMAIFYGSGRKIVVAAHSEWWYEE